MLFGTTDTFVVEKGGAEDAESLLDMPVLGYIPTVDEKNRRVSGLSSPLMEGYRTLRAYLRFATAQPLNSILVTSSVPNEGKSTTVANLAAAMAMVLEIDGKRLIVVDADLRRPTQHRLFNIDASLGLADVLRGTHTIEDVLRPTDIANLWVIPAGAVSQNSTELLESDAMSRFMTQVEALCGMILVDSPSVLAAVDAAVLASRTGGVLLVIAHGETKRVSVQKAAQVLRRAHANLLGATFNRIGKFADNYYYSKSSSTFDTAAADAAAERQTAGTSS